MRLRPVQLLAIWVASAALLLLPTQVAAQEAEPVGLLVVKGDGSTTSACVPWSEELRTGYDLIVAAGVDFTSEQAAMGATICSLEGEGCAYPRESCFCQCQGSPCTYWSYWLLQDEGWQYSNQGAANQRIEAGDVQAWVWGAGASDSAPEPPPVELADLCRGEEPAVSEAVVGSDGVSTLDTTSMASSPAAEVEQVDAATSGIGPWVWLAAAAVVPLLALLFLSRRRKTDDSGRKDPALLE